MQPFQKESSRCHLLATLRAVRENVTEPSLTKLHVTISKLPLYLINHLLRNTTTDRICHYPTKTISVSAINKNRISVLAMLFASTAERSTLQVYHYSVSTLAQLSGTLICQTIIILCMIFLFILTFCSQQQQWHSSKRERDTREKDRTYQVDRIIKS